MRRILVLLLLLSAAVPLCAQQNDSDILSMSVAEFRRMKVDRMWQDYPKFEVRVGYGGFPIVDVLEYSSNGLEDAMVSLFNPVGDLESMYTPDEGATYMTGNIMAEFSWHAEKWLTVAGILSFNGIYGSMVDPSTGEVLSRDRGVTFSFIPTARFYWANFEKCRLYSAIGVGFMTTNGYRHIKNFIPTFQLTPFGITAGGKVFFFAEYSLGMTYLGGQIGLGYRF
jgi:hypothetical protein